MWRHIRFADAAGIRARRVEKSAAGASCALNHFLRENEEIVGIVVVLFADHVDEAGPTMAEADDLVAFMKRTNRDAADCGIEAGNIAASSKNADDTLFGVDICHDAEPFPRNGEPTIIHVRQKFRKCGSKLEICLGATNRRRLPIKLKLNLCTEDAEKFGEPGVERGPRWAGD